MSSRAVGISVRLKQQIDVVAILLDLALNSSMRYRSRPDGISG
jgi:hypothetical protein